MLKLGRVTKAKVFFLVLIQVFDIDLFEFSAAILEKGLFWPSLHNFYDREKVRMEHCVTERVLKQNWRDLLTSCDLLLLLTRE